MLRRILKISIPVLLVAALLGLLVIRTAITRSLATVSAEALAAAPAAGDRIEALMVCVADKQQPLERRNRAVWALGQLRDARALPVLQRYVKDTCDHGAELCQHELSKAIALCENPGRDLLRTAGH